MRLRLLHRPSQKLRLWLPKQLQPQCRYKLQHLLKRAFLAGSKACLAQVTRLPHQQCLPLM